MRDFRMIREFEIQWKQTQEQLSAAHQGAQDAPTTGGQEHGLEDMLNEMLEERGLTDDQYF